MVAVMMMMVALLMMMMAVIRLSRLNSYGPKQQNDQGNVSLCIT